MRPEKEQEATPGRPVLITVICVIGFGSVLLALPAIPRMVSVLGESYGAWYVPVWIGSLALTFISLVGYWLMRRWGVYLYVAAFLAGTVLGIVAGLPFTVQGIIVPVAVSVIGAVYLRQMR